MQYKQPLWGWSWRGDFSWRGSEWPPSSSVSSSTSLAVVRPRRWSHSFPRGLPLSLLGGGTERRDRTFRIHLTTGIFTAPRTGTYSFSVSGIANFSSSSTRLFFGVNFYLNGSPVGKGNEDHFGYPKWFWNVFPPINAEVANTLLFSSFNFWDLIPRTFRAAPVFSGTTPKYMGFAQNFWN